MSAPTTVASSEGSLFELLARGNKDVYFFQDFPTSKFIFDNQYEAQAPSSFEIRRVPPLTAVEFGRMVEFELDLVGDVMRDPTLLITLPSWLPPSYQATNTTSVIQDLSGNTYGYTNGIGYFLFEKIQFYQDNILLQEFSGDSLWASSQIEGTFSKSPIHSKQTGQHSGTALEIARNATPQMLRLSIPLPGCQKNSDPGFPQRSCISHRYKLKCKLRKLEDLIECSDGREKPSPFGIQMTQQTSRDTTPTQFQTLQRIHLLPLSIQFETKQVYLPREYQDLLQKTPSEIPFNRVYENIFTTSPSDYISVQGGSTSSITRRLDARHPSQRLLWFFRNQTSIKTNQLWKLTTGYSSLALLIAGQVRETSRSPLVWRDIVNQAKEELDSSLTIDSVPLEIGTMNWSLGSIAPKRFDIIDSQPTGSIEFSTADRPTLYIELANPNVQNPYIELRVLIDTWAVFQTDGKGRAELLSAN